VNLIALCSNSAQSSKSSWFEHLKRDVLIIWPIFIRNLEHSKSAYSRCKSETND